MPAAKHILVVGAGLIGASIAWHLVRAGVRVAIVDPEASGGVATPASFAWLNASWGNPEFLTSGCVSARCASDRGWRARHPAFRFAEPAGLLGHPPAERAVFGARYRAWGYDIRRVGRAEAAELEPDLLIATEN